MILLNPQNHTNFFSFDSIPVVGHFFGGSFVFDFGRSGSAGTERRVVSRSGNIMDVKGSLARMLIVGCVYNIADFVVSWLVEGYLLENVTSWDSLLEVIEQVYKTYVPPCGDAQVTGLKLYQLLGVVWHMLKRLAYFGHR